VRRVALVAGLVLGLAGCGGDEDGSTTPGKAPPQATAPGAKPPPPDAATAEPEDGPGTSKPDGGPPPGPEEQPGGAGDEEPIRVPATYRVRAGRLSPPSITVPAFLAVRVEVASTDGRRHTVVLEAGERRVLRVPAGGRDSVLLDGLKPGRYRLELDGGRDSAALVAGGEPGP